MSEGDFEREVSEESSYYYDEDDDTGVDDDSDTAFYLPTILRNSKKSAPKKGKKKKKKSKGGSGLNFGFGNKSGTGKQSGSNVGALASSGGEPRKSMTLSNDVYAVSSPASAVQIPGIASTFPKPAASLKNMD